MIFVNSMSDLFHEDVSFEFILDVLKVVEQCPQHIFQVLTKRPQRVNAFTNWYLHQYDKDYFFPDNCWMGVSVENQAQADERIPYLINFPVQIIFISCEPLLGRVDVREYIRHIDWVIAGGETGTNARPMQPEWIRFLREQSSTTNFFFKQWGSWQPNESGKLEYAGRIKNRVLDGVYWNATPLQQPEGKCA